MAGSCPKRFVDWEEQFVSHDRGSRVVHYYLRDRHGSSSLAVVGTERSLRHMVYLVCDEFLPLAGLDRSTTSAFKWRSRREVVDWLATFLVKPRLSPSSSGQHISKSPKNGSPAHLEAAPFSNGEDTEFLDGSSQDEGRNHVQDHVMKKKDYGISVGEVVWVGVAWSCRKRLQHYQSFRRNGITISVHDFVCVMSEGRDHHIAYIEDMYEDKKSKKKVRVRWFHKMEELVGPVPPPVPHAREVFFTPFPQVLSVECVDGLATVLTPEHYEKCMLTLPADALAQTHMCFRQFDNEGVKPLNISEVEGYWHQKALLHIELALHQDSLNCDVASDSMEMDDDEETDIGNLVRRGPRTARCSRRRAGMAERLKGGCNGEASLASSQDFGRFGGAVDTGPESTIREMKPPKMSRKEHDESGLHDQTLPAFDVGDKVELLCQDSGVRGCWFRCTVVRRFPRRVKVRYEELDSEDGHGKLEEWVSPAKIAASDRLGMRIFGRLTMRPSPSETMLLSDCEIGSAVDAWWNDGWWEGVVLSKGVNGEVGVYFPGENDTASFQMSELRVSRDWFNGHWLNVKSSQESLKLISSLPSVSLTHGFIPHLTEQMQQTALSSCIVDAFNVDIFPPRPSKVYKLNECLPPSLVVKVRKNSIEQVQQSDENAYMDAREQAFQYSTEAELSVATAAANICTEVNFKNNAQTFDFAKGSVKHEGISDISSIMELRIQDKQCKLKSEKEDLSADTPQGKEEIELRRRMCKKRQRQANAVVLESLEKEGDTLLRVEARECSADILPEEESCDTDMEDATTPENRKELNNSQSEGNNEDLVKMKKTRPEHENLKPIHGPPIGGSLFMNSMPMASLVMSR